MKTSARNELYGIITEIQNGQVMSEIKVDISPEITLSATITNEAAHALELRKGEGVTALVKSSFIILSKEKLRATARNNFLTTVEDIIPGAVNCEVKLSAGKQTLCAIITDDSCEGLDLKTGDQVYAIFKASSVMLVA
ncbi:MAG: TOBE domain-containing protein [Sulfurimonas sp.]